MNLFFLDDDFEKCAQYHVDKHVSKIFLEAMQIVCTNFNLQEINAPYRASHKNHPTTVWARASRANFEWVINYGSALSKEYSYRYSKQHACNRVLSWAQANAGLLSFPSEEPTSFTLAMPEKYRKDCPIQSYRSYYIGEKSHLFSWTKRRKPDWIPA
jgi:hypothetical protein